MNTDANRSVGRFTAQVAAAFDDIPPDIGDEFLRDLRASWREVLTRCRHLVFLVVLLAALFTLMTGADIAEIAFAGVKLSPNAVDVITIAIPAIAAYLYSEYWGLYLLADRYQDLHDEIFDRVHPTMGSLRYSLHPPEASHAGMYLFMTLGRRSARQGLTAVTSVANLLIIFLAPLAFLLAAYVVLFADFGFGCPEVLISLTLSLACVVRTVGFWSLN